VLRRCRNPLEIARVSAQAATLLDAAGGAHPHPSLAAAALEYLHPSVRVTTTSLVAAAAEYLHPSVRATTIHLEIAREYPTPGLAGSRPILLTGEPEHGEALLSSAQAAETARP